MRAEARKRNVDGASMSSRLKMFINRKSGISIGTCGDSTEIESRQIDKLTFSPQNLKFDLFCFQYITPH